MPWSALVPLETLALFRREKAPALERRQRFHPFANRLCRLVVHQAVKHIAVTFANTPGTTQPPGHVLPDGDRRVRHTLKMHYPLTLSIVETSMNLPGEPRASTEDRQMRDPILDSLPAPHQEGDFA